MPRLAFLLALAAAGARANGRFPATSSAAARPGGQEILVGATFGAAVTRDGGATWRWLCEAAMGYGGAIDPVFVWTSRGDLFAATPMGLLVSRDGGCTWTTVRPGGRGVSFVAVHPTDPTVVLATTATGSLGNGLFASTDAGSSFSATSLVRDSMAFTAVRFAPSNPSRVYVSASWLNPQGAWLFRSDDGGSTFAELAQPFSGLYSSFALLATHPTQPDVLLAWLDTSSDDLVLRSEDAGSSFRTVLVLQEARGAVFSADGAQAWVAAQDRVHRSNDGGRTFTALQNPRKNACVAHEGAALYACGWPWLDGWAFAKSQDGGASWQGQFTLQDIAGPIECPAGTPGHDECRPLWPSIAELLGAGKKPDAGPAAGDGENGSCKGCASGGGAWTWLVALGALARRRRREGSGNLFGIAMFLWRSAARLLCAALALIACSEECEPGYGGRASDEAWKALLDAEVRATQDDAHALAFVEPAEGQTFSRAGPAPTFRWTTALRAEAAPQPRPAPSRSAPPRWLSRPLAWIAPGGDAWAHLPPVTGDIHWLRIDVPGRTCPVAMLTTELSWTLSEADWAILKEAEGSLAVRALSAYLTDNVVTEGPYVPSAARAFQVGP